MTPTEQAARWLEDVPRINDPLYTSATMREADAISAIARHLAPGDDLVERLLAVDHMSVEDCFTQSPLFAQAAARISALTAQVKAIENTLSVSISNRNFIIEERDRTFALMLKRAETAEAEVATLRDRLARMEEALRPFDACVFNDNGDITISTGHLGRKDWIGLRAALTDGGSNVIPGAKL